MDIDEFWKELGDDAFRAFAQDGLKTYRKQNAFLVFGTQSPADALRSDISHSIMEQVATKILLPNPHGREVDYIDGRSEEHTSELQSLMRISYAVFCLTKKKIITQPHIYSPY